MSTTDQIKERVGDLAGRIGGLASHAPGADQVKERIGGLAANAPSANQIKDFGFRYLPRVHKALIGATGGRIGASFGGMPMVELHTVGRKSGLARTTILAAPVHDDEKVVLVASKGGDARHPEWFLNLQADPDVEVVIAGETRQLRARTASDAEKAELWPEIVAAYKSYDGYQKRTDRSIPVVICEPRPPAG